jgi:hypothetical protein
MNKLRAFPVQREVSGITLAERTVTFVSESMADALLTIRSVH